MDPIGAIKYAKDSTLAMLLAAQARGFALTYLEQQDLSLRDGVACGRMRPLTVRADADELVHARRAARRAPWASSTAS